MTMDTLKEIPIEILLSDTAAEKIRTLLETISFAQRNLIALAESEDDGRLSLLRIGTVFQIFLIDTLASGKRPGELTTEAWRAIAVKVSRHAVLEDGKSYSAFVFTMYADYVDLSAESIRGFISDENADSIRELSATIRKHSEALQEGNMTEPEYVESCLWLSLEAMIRLLSCYVTAALPAEYAKLAQAASRLAFEYGRYVLCAKEQAILERYLQNQRELDESLRIQYESFQEELREQAERFQGLIDAAFSPGLRESLQRSSELARAAGVKEEEILESLEDVDAFFMD